MTDSKPKSVLVIPEESEISKGRKLLPIFEHRDAIVDALEKSQILILIGETGSGKSTQIAQYLAEAGYGKKGQIGVTQPRRVGAVSVARRVADEYGCSVGDEVGYTVRFTDKTSRRTVIKFMTDGMLLRECLADQYLKNYSVIVLDEAHERSVNTDILFGLMKRTISRRPDLKVLVTSATLDDEKFSRFFDGCPVFFVPGRSHPVDIFYWERKRKHSTFTDAAVDCVLEIHKEEPPGDVLVFLTGQNEIDDAVRRINREVDKLFAEGFQGLDMLVLPLYAALPPAEQIKIFSPTPEGTRKVVVATNIAETSLTVNGIVYVVDPGYVKQKAYNPRTGMESLQVQPISKVAALQRSGRAGRTQAGKCFRLYTREVHKMMDDVTVPEIQRSNLGNVVLQLKALGVHDVIGFDFLDRPEPLLLIDAIKHLYSLGALDEDGRITELGMQMSAFPLEPSFSRMLIASVDLRCSDEMLTLLSMMSLDNLFYRPPDRKVQEQASERHAELFLRIDTELAKWLTGDHFMMLYIYEEWLRRDCSPGWCKENFIQPKSMQEARDIRQQLEEIMQQQKLDVLSSAREKSTKYERVAKAVCHGLYTNIARHMQQQPDKRKLPKKHSKFDGDEPPADEDLPTRASDFTYHVSHKGVVAMVHPSSGLMYTLKPPPECLVYTELVHSTRVFIREVCSIRSEWVEELHAKRAKMNVDRLLGYSVQEVLERANPARDEPVVSQQSKDDESALLQKLNQKHTTDDAADAARKRYLERKAAQQQSSKKRK